MNGNAFLRYLVTQFLRFDDSLQASTFTVQANTTNKNRKKGESVEFMLRLKNTRIQPVFTKKTIVDVNMSLCALHVQAEE